MIIVAIANQKGGVGKTTTAVNLSAYLAAKGKRVLLLDLDPQANTTSALGFSDGQSDGLYRALLGETRLRDAIIPTRMENLYVLPTDMNLAGAEVEVARTENHLGRLRSVLEDLRFAPSWDYILMDCPPSLGILMTNALAAADELLIPVQCEFFALEGLSKITQVIDQIRIGGNNPNLRLGGIVLTMFDHRTSLNKQVLAEVQKHFGELVYKTLIPRTIRLGEAPSFGKTILEFDPTSTAAVAYDALADEFLQRHATK
jgi:chromosome partitioning protein